MNQTIPTFMLVLGFLGQALFSARFLVQWLVSERRGESTIPLAFWFLSIGGGLTLLAYAVLRRDPVFILGQSGGLVVYVRNLALIAKKRKSTKNQ
ncbi:MAG: lipid-A-disaccharide synthase N-terminal domain-containing protein [Thermoanaerobaculales bacterium]|nr:lipid-A-disaccharide synthase N-terminal domain-containing protein [Thermoanaerobaculales bacterium]